MGAIYHQNVKYTGVNMPDDYSIIGPEEKTATASQPYVVGEHFVKDGYFCTAIAAIAQGATLTLNTNYTQGDIAGAIKNTREAINPSDIFDSSTKASVIDSVVCNAAVRLGNSNLCIVQLAITIKAGSAAAGMAGYSIGRFKKNFAPRPISPLFSNDTAEIRGSLWVNNSNQDSKIYGNTVAGLSYSTFIGIY